MRSHTLQPLEQNRLVGMPEAIRLGLCGNDEHAPSVLRHIERYVRRSRKTYAFPAVKSSFRQVKSFQRYPPPRQSHRVLEYACHANLEWLPISTEHGCHPRVCDHLTSAQSPTLSESRAASHPWRRTSASARPQTCCATPC